MANSERRPSNHPDLKKILHRVWGSKSFATVSDKAHRARARQSGRFSGVHDWGRLILLGVLLIDLALLGMSAPSLGWTLVGYWPGLAATFAGLLMAIIMIKLSRPAVYWDWTALGCLVIILGVMLKSSPHLVRPLEAVVFYGLLNVASLLFLWIAATTRHGNGRAWLGGGGLACLIVTAFGFVDHLTTGLLSSEVVLLTTVVLIGMSVFGLGVSLRSKAA